MSKTLVTTAPSGVEFTVRTRYTANAFGAGRIIVTTYAAGRKAQQRTMPYDHAARDPHAAAILEAFGLTGRQLVIREIDRPSQAFAPKRTWAVKTK